MLTLYKLVTMATHYGYTLTIINKIRLSQGQHTVCEMGPATRCRDFFHCLCDDTCLSAARFIVSEGEEEEESSDPVSSLT